MRTPLIVLVIVAGAALLRAADTGAVRGLVVDGRTGLPIAGAAVTIQPPGAEVVSGPEGAFRVEGVPAGPVTVEVSVLRYGFVRQPLDILPGQQADVVLRLAEGTADFSDEVTVQEVFATRGGAPAESRIGGAALQDLRGVMMDDPFRAVQALPGVSAPDDLHSVFAVRGTGFRHMGFAVDGVPAPFLLHTVREQEGGGSVSMITGHVIEEASLRPGARAQTHGDRTGAMLEVHTREGSRARVRTSIALSGSSASAVVEGPLGRGSWLVSGRKSYTEYVLKRIFDDATFTFGFGDVFAKVVQEPAPGHQVLVGLLGGQSRFDDLPEDVGINEAADAVQTAGLGYVGWRFASSNLVVDQRLHATAGRFTNRNEDGFELDHGAESGRGWRGEAGWTLSRSWLLQGGAHVSWWDEDHRASRFEFDRPPAVVHEDLDARRTTTGGWTQVRWTPSPRVSITPGVRVDHGTGGTSAVSPWVLTEGGVGPLKLRAAISIAHQAPALHQLRGLEGSADLRPERSRHLDVALEHALAPTLRWQVAAFKRTEEDVLRLQDSEVRLVDGTPRFPGPGESRWENALHGEASGIEALLERRGTGRLTGWVAYAWLRHRLEDVSRREEFPSDFELEHATSLYMQARFSASTSLGLKVRVASGAPIPGYWLERRPSAILPPLAPNGGMIAQFGEFVAAERNRLRLPVYSRVDVRASHAMRWGRARATLFAEVANATSTENRRPSSPSVNGRTGRVTGLTEELFPLVPSAGLLVEF